MKTYKKNPELFWLTRKKINKEIWQEQRNAQDCNIELKFQNVQRAVLRVALAICEITDNLINRENINDIFR